MDFVPVLAGIGGAFQLPPGGREIYVVFSSRIAGDISSAFKI